MVFEVHLQRQEALKQAKIKSVQNMNMINQDAEDVRLFKRCFGKI